MFKLLYNCTHLTHQQSNAQSSPRQASIALEPRTSRCTNWILKRQNNQSSNCQHPLDHRKSKKIPDKHHSASFTMLKPYVDHNKLWKILQDMGITDHLTCLLRNLYAGQESTIRTRHETTEWFKIGKGILQIVTGLHIYTFLI